MTAIGYGSAPCDPDIINFLKVVTGLPICQGYGCTEVAAVTIVQHMEDHSSGYLIYAFLKKLQ